MSTSDRLRFLALTVRGWWQCGRVESDALVLWTLAIIFAVIGADALLYGLFGIGPYIMEPWR